MARIIRCLSVNVYRDSGVDCTNDGVSKFFDRLLVECPTGPHSFDAERETPLNFCRVNVRNFRGGVLFDIRPAAVTASGAVVDRGNRWYMMGGNFAHTCDSRFMELLEARGNSAFYGAVAIHDRTE